MVRVVRAKDAAELAAARQVGPADVALQQLRGALRSAVHAFLELEIAVRKLELDRFDLITRASRSSPASKEIPVPAPKEVPPSEGSPEKPQEKSEGGT